MWAHSRMARHSPVRIKRFDVKKMNVLPRPSTRVLHHLGKSEVPRRVAQSGDGEEARGPSKLEEELGLTGP